MKYLIAYHSEDNDGVFSAAIAKSHLISQLNVGEENITAIGFTYNELNKIDKNAVTSWVKEYDGGLIMVDLSFSDPNMMKFAIDEFNGKFIWIDHHAPAINASFKLGYSTVAGERDIDRSATMLTFKFFFDPLDEAYHANNVPMIYKVVSWYDSWTYDKSPYDLETITNINRGITEAFELDINKAFTYADYANREFLQGIYPNMNQAIDNYCYFGKQFNRVDARKNAVNMKQNCDKLWKVGDRTAGMIVTVGPTNSQMFKTIQNEVQNGICLKRNNDGNWTLSLYNVRENDHSFHCGNYLKEHYGGGGHEGAAGCQLSESQFINILKNKTI